jgi:superfamily II DNA/RNA helicase
VKLAVSKPGDNIDQSAAVCYEAQKTAILKHLFQTVSSKRVIVFAASKLKVKELTRELRRKKYNVGEIHSDLEQTKRDEVLREFRAGHIDALIATDIVARGIDIDDITMVVNYDVPHESEDYVHRIGRTARAGANGCAVTFVSEKEQRDFAEIERFLGKEVRKLQLPAEIGETPAYRPARPSRGNRRRPNSPGRPNKPNKPNRYNKSNRPNKPNKGK